MNSSEQQVCVKPFCPHSSSRHTRQKLAEASYRSGGRTGVQEGEGKGSIDTFLTEDIGKRRPPMSSKNYLKSKLGHSQLNICSTKKCRGIQFTKSQNILSI